MTGVQTCALPISIAVALGAYRFVRYGKPANEVRLEVPEQADGAELTRIVEAVYLARDLINTPANDMGPAELAGAAVALAARHGAAVSVTVGVTVSLVVLPRTAALVLPAASVAVTLYFSVPSARLLRLRLLIDQAPVLPAVVVALTILPLLSVTVSAMVAPTSAVPATVTLL